MDKKARLFSWILSVAAIACFAYFFLKSNHDSSSGEQSRLVERTDPLFTQLKNRAEKSRKMLLGKRLVYSDKGGKSGQVLNMLYVYHETDCSSCIEKGLEAANKIRNEVKAANIHWKSISLSNDSIENLNDQERRLQGRLKYVYTPVLIVLDRGLVIDTYHPLLGFDDNGEVERIIEILGANANLP